MKPYERVARMGREKLPRTPNLQGKLSEIVNEKLNEIQTCLE